MLAGVVDHLWSHSETARSLPHGETRLLLTLVALYAATGGLLGLAGGLALRVIGLAVEARRAPAEPQAPPSRRIARWGVGGQ